jgi:protocatechuate 3,4-dioxygenase beta subunit
MMFQIDAYSQCPAACNQEVPLDWRAIRPKSAILPLFSFWRFEMQPYMPLTLHRRLFLQRAMAASAAFFTVRGAYAEQIARTPGTARMTEGPFYPDKLPLDTDNDLLIINDSITPAVGEITHLTGRVLGPTGEPMRNALVEIWQCDNGGAYIHSKSGNKDKRDSNFQGYGRFLTDSKGQYYFRTIKPVPYPGRTPHIHFAVTNSSKRVLTTQLFIKGYPQNERDGIFNRAGEARHTVEGDFKPLEGSTAGELAVNWDIVAGLTPEDRKQDRGTKVPAPKRKPA